MRKNPNPQEIAGRRAYQRGDTVDVCPYLPTSAAEELWLDGWNEAKADHEDAIAGARS